MDMEDILNSGDTEAIDKVMAALEGGMSEEEAIASLGKGDSQDDELDAATAEAEESAETAEAEPEEASAADSPPQEAEQQDAEDAEGVYSKDGKRILPFDIVLRERREKAELRGQLDDLNRKNELLAQQLRAADIKPRDLPENVRYTDEQLAEFETFGEIGEAVAVLARQNAILMEEIQRRGMEPVAPEVNPVTADVDLSRWAKDDDDWAVVESVERKLMLDPDWATKSLLERIPEIKRRAAAALGDALQAAASRTEAQPTTDTTIDAKAQAALKAAQRKAPTSLTEIGGANPDSEKTIGEKLAGMSESELADYLEVQASKGKSVDEVLAALL